MTMRLEAMSDVDDSIDDDELIVDQYSDEDDVVI